MDAAPIDSALVLSAHAARRFAHEHCPLTPDGDCSWYHGVWQYLRVLGVMKTAGGSAAYFDETLRHAAAAGDVRRVFISGAADDAMSLLTLAAFRAAKRPLDLTVVDRCETPLALSRWSATQRGATVTTYRSNILAFDRGESFDLVMTNSFLGSFAPSRRAELFGRWASLLRRGGKLLFSNRLRPKSNPESFGFTPEQARSFCVTVRREAERSKAVLGLDPATVEGWARVYAERYRSYPVRSEEVIVALLQEAGFTPHRVETVRFAGNRSDVTVAGPSVAEPADYVRVLAIRS
jgi:SAM-dependent methyltransferase